MLRPWLGAFDNIYAIAALWIGLAFLASLISIRVGLSVALVEIVVGVAAGNLFQLSTNTWVDFLASSGSVLLTFLAGAEIDPGSLRRFALPSLVIGGVGFVAPFVGAWAFAWYALHWQWHARAHQTSRHGDGAIPT
ncbi:MAG: hypothetical protein DLM67_11755, partial [Candidatus Nephthysia bennettiae]